jgi:hypothetical protein
MRFEVALFLYVCIASVETFALAYFFKRFLIRKYKTRVYIISYMFYFIINFLLSAFVSDVWGRSIFGMMFPFAVSCALYSGTALRRLFFAGFALVFHMTAEPLTAVFISWATGRIFPEIPTGDAFYFISAGCSTLLYAASVYAVTRHNRLNAAMITARQYVVLLLMALMCVVMAYAYLWMILRSGMAMSPVHIFLEFCVCAMPIFIFFVFERFQEHAHEKMRTGILSAQLAQNEKLFGLMETHQKEIRRLKHDFKGQLMTVRALAERGANDELILYINKYTELVTPTLDKTITGLSGTDAVIASKKSLSEENGIGFVICVPIISDIKVNQIHLNNILINALDNAIESCASMPADDRRIELGLKTESDFLFIRIVNTAPPVSIENGRFPATSKADAESHGNGLESISESVEKCGGIMSIDYSDGLFMLLIRLLNY